MKQYKTTQKRSDYRKEHYRKNRERTLAVCREYRQKHADELKAYRDKHRDEKRTYNQAYQTANREKLSEYRKQYYQQTIEKRRQYNRDYCKANRQAFTEYGRRWRKENPEKFRAQQQRWAARNKQWRKENLVLLRIHDHRRREREKATMDRSAINVLSQLISSAGRLKCGICEKNMPKNDRTIDHIIPLAKGGTGDVWNLRIVHHLCNIRKHATMPDELNFARNGAQPKTNPKRERTRGESQIDIPKCRKETRTKEA
jgi:hypothetical protein